MGRILLCLAQHARSSKLTFMTRKTLFSLPSRLHPLFAVSLTGCALILSGVIAHAEALTFEELLAQAAANANGNRAEAFALVNRAIVAEPKDARGYFVRARLYESNHQPAKAISDYDQALRIDPNIAAAWQHRGGEHFKLAHIKESIADFDRFLALVPEQVPYHWQRGIAYYYAGRFEEGRQQFEAHQGVNSNDVENAVWHFLCVARSAGLEKARSALIPIKGDARIPMMEVHALFAGMAKPEDVLKVAGAGEPSSPRIRQQMFFAHLYLGLYFEATGDEKKAREHILKATEEFKSDDYMGDVARVHRKLRWPDEKAGETKDNAK